MAADNPLAPDGQLVTRIRDRLEGPLALRDYFAIGRDLRRLADHPAVQATLGWRRRAAELTGMSESNLTKALRLFDEYAPDELAELERIDVGWGRLTVAFGVPDKAARHALLGRARAEGWSNRDVQLEVQKAKGGRRAGGRPRRARQSRGPLADAAELRRATAAWLAVYRAVWEAGRATRADEVAAADRAALAGLAREVKEAAALLGEAADACRTCAADLAAIAGIRPTA